MSSNEQQMFDLEYKVAKIELAKYIESDNPNLAAIAKSFMDRIDIVYQKPKHGFNHEGLRTLRTAYINCLTAYEKLMKSQNYNYYQFKKPLRWFFICK